MKKILLALLISLTLALSACSATPIDNDKPLVITTLFPQYEFVRLIAQDKVTLQLLLPPGVESHSFDPTPATILSIGKADLFIYTNLEMEPWIERIVENVKSETLLILNSSEGIQLIKDRHEHDDHDDDHHDDDHDDDHHDDDHDDDHHDDDHDDDHHDDDHDDDHHDDDHDDDHHDDDHDDDHHHGEYDPHVWLDPLNAIVMVENILNSLIQIDPSNEAFFRKNAADVVARLQELDEAFNTLFENNPSRTIIYGGHFAFGYLASRYNITILSPYTGFAPDAEPTPRAIIQLIDTMAELNINTIYYEELIDPKTARVISEQTGAKMVLLHGAHNLSKEDMEAGLTYFDIMFENIAKLQQGFSNE